jgi:hypothetical protein
MWWWCCDGANKEEEKSQFESASDASGGSVRRPLRIGSYIALWLIRKGSEFS